MVEPQDIFSTTDEISKKFDQALQICFNYDQFLNDSEQKYSETIEIFKKIEKSIIMHGIFSPNEDFNELLPENIKFFQTKDKKFEFFFKKIFIIAFLCGRCVWENLRKQENCLRDVTKIFNRVFEAFRSL